MHSGMTLHINLAYGKNTHHIIEGIFKAFGCAFKQAVSLTGTGIPSTKGVL
jgi:imidazoleglycerol-phosphate dehydratase